MGFGHLRISRSWWDGYIGLDRRDVRACGRRLGLDGIGIELDGTERTATIGNGGNGDHPQEGNSPIRFSDSSTPNPLPSSYRGRTPERSHGPRFTGGALHGFERRIIADLCLFFRRRHISLYCYLLALALALVPLALNQ